MNLYPLTFRPQGSDTMTPPPSQFPSPFNTNPQQNVNTNVASRSSQNPTTTTTSSGTSTQFTDLPPWVTAGLQGQFNQSTQDAQGARNFFNSILGGTNSAADLWANRTFNQMMQQATGAPSFTNSGASAQGMAAGEAAAAVQAGMMDRMFAAAGGLNGLTAQTVPFLNMAGQFAPRTTNTNNTSTTEYDDGKPNNVFTMGPSTVGLGGGGSSANLLGLLGRTDLGTVGPTGDFNVSPHIAFLLQAMGIPLPGGNSSNSPRYNYSNGIRP